MIEIRRFCSDIFCGEDTLMLGGNSRKERTCFELINAWLNDFPDIALVVFDYKGAIYDRFAGNAYLMDLASENSIVADLIEPFVVNNDFGISCENIAYMLRQFIYQEIKSRDANDKFFDDLGKILTDRMLTYMLLTAKNVIQNIASNAKDYESAEESVISTLKRLNLFTIFCRQHRFIETLMTKTINGESNSLPTKRKVDEQAASGKLTREYALAKYISEHEARFQKDSERDAPIPFADILFTNGDNTNTQRCIKMQADASTADFRNMIDHLVSNASVLLDLPSLKLDKWISAPCGTPLFISSSGVPSADCGVAPLAIAAIGCVCEMLGRRALIVMPEIDRWGLLNYLDKLRQNFDSLNFVFSYGNFTRLTLESRTDEKSLIETLYSQSTQRLWHSTEEERLTAAFETYVAAADIIYRPEDLDDSLRAVEKDGFVRYVYMTEKSNLPIIKKRVKLHAKKGIKNLWITEGVKKFERLTLESLLEDGETL